MLSRELSRLLGIVFSARRTARSTGKGAFSIRTRRGLTEGTTRRDVILLGGRSRVLPLGPKAGITIVNSFTGAPECRNTKSSLMGPTGRPRTVLSIVKSASLSIITCRRKCVHGEGPGRGLAGTTMRLTGGTSVMLFFKKLSRVDRSRKLSHARVSVPTTRRALLGRLAAMGGGVVMILSTKSTVRVP